MSATFGTNIFLTTHKLLCILTFCSQVCKDFSHIKQHFSTSIMRICLYNCKKRAFHQDNFLVFSFSTCINMLESLRFAGNLKNRSYSLILVYFCGCIGARVPVVLHEPEN